MRDIAMRKMRMSGGRGRWVLLGLNALAIVVLVSVIIPASATHAAGALAPAWASKFDAVDATGKNSDQGPGSDILTAALAAYQARAYPAQDIPFQATLDAQAAFSQIEARSQGDHSGMWQLIGPSMSVQPGVLSFTGAQYITSGRVTALAVSPRCGEEECRVWVAAAGGGVWRTDNALSSTPEWKFISASFGTSAIGTLTVDPTDASGNTIYAGTGEANASGDSEAGVGIYKSTDGGDTWSLLPGSQAATYARAVSSIVVDPTNSNTIYVGTTRAVRGVSSVTGGATSAPPPGVAAPFGLYKSTDGGATFTRVWDGAGTIRGVNHVALDPADHNTVYAAAYQHGIWRSSDGGATFAQIFSPTSPAQNTDRSEFAVTTLANGNTRMYVGDGAIGPGGGAASQAFRSDSVRTGAPAFTSITSSTNGTAQYGTYNFCTGQCWYDNAVYTPAGHPDTVVFLGSFQYGELGGRSNGRAVVMSKDAGATYTDETNDATSDTTPNGLHPDQHALVFLPGNPDVWFEGSDGGVVRSSGQYKDVTYQCDARPVSAASKAECKQLLKAVPTRLINLNKGLSTLQFQSLSASPSDPTGNLMGGTQDNGTWQYSGSSVVWNQAIYGDGGQSGYNAANPAIRFNTFFGEATDTNFHNGDPTKWVVTSGPLENSPEGSAFYMPIIADPNPANGGYMFAGLEGVWRTTDNGGNQAYLEANCPEFTTNADDPKCGDWVELGSGALNTSAYGGDRLGGTMAAVERAPSDTSTLWAATSRGRVFISKNANASVASSVGFTRLDSLASNAPGRFVSGIYVDPSNPNHAWISYSGYNFNTPSQPGHVFEVTYDPVSGTATWNNLDAGTGPMGDLPVTGLVRDDLTGDLYASTDFGVLKLANGSSSWMVAAPGMSHVEVAGLTISVHARVLYAATHGRSAWRLNLSGDNGNNGN